MVDIRMHKFENTLDVKKVANCKITPDAHMKLIGACSIAAIQLAQITSTYQMIFICDNYMFL